MIDKSNALPEETRFDLAAMNGYVDSFSRASASCLRHERSNAKKLYELLPDDKLLTKESLDRCRQAILESNLSINTVYSFATTVNKICRYLNRPDLCYERTKKNDLAGKRFGELTVIDTDGSKNSSRQILWRCRCSCGREIVVPSSALKLKNVTDCGCRKKERRRNSPYCTGGTNVKNVLSEKLYSTNTSGHKGVYRKRGKWAASIQYKKKKYYLGVYDSIEEAIRVRNEAEAVVRDDAMSILEAIKEINGEQPALRA